MAGDITTIARPYARAVFELAKDTGQLDAWSGALGLLASIAASEDLAQQIANPSIPRERVRDIVLDVAGDALSGQGRRWGREHGVGSRRGRESSGGRRHL